jgi:hypothetical protein
VAVIVAAGTPKNGANTVSLPRMSWSGAYQRKPPCLRWRIAGRISSLLYIAQA